MPSLTAYGLDQFVADMVDLLKSEPDQAQLVERGSSFLQRLLCNPNAVSDEFKRPLGRGKWPNHGRYALFRCEGLLVSAVVWGPGDYIDPHDHRTWGMIGLLENAIQETRYRRVDDRNQEGYAKLEKDRTMLLKPGEISVLIPEVDEIHRLDNFSDHPTVEIHVYGKDLVGLPRYRYNPETCEAVRFASGKFDNC